MPLRLLDRSKILDKHIFSSYTFQIVNKPFIASFRCYYTVADTQSNHDWNLTNLYIWAVEG